MAQGKTSDAHAVGLVWLTAMMLVEEGKIHLDDSISQYLDGTPPAWQQITVRDLLAQTSGLKDFINEPTTATLRLDATDEQIMEAAATRPLNFPPAQAWAYSNTNYLLLAMIIHKVTGKWYGDFLAERIFKPLGMTQTAVMRDGEIVPDRAMGYLLENGTLRTGKFVAPSILGYGGGGIRSTVLDMAKWDAALYTEKLLKHTTLHQMWTPTPKSGTTHGYGFGWEIEEIAGHRLVSHGGDLGTGFSAQIDRFVDDHLTVIVLTNLDGSLPGRIARAVAGTYLPAVGLPVYKPIADNEPQVTAHLLDLLQRSASGNLHSEDYTPAMWAQVSPQLDQMRINMAPLGPIEKLTLVERTDKGVTRSYRYQAQFKNTTFILHFVITGDGKISLMEPEEVNQ